MNTDLLAASQTLLDNIGKPISLEPPTPQPVGSGEQPNSIKGSRFHYLSEKAAHALIAALSSGRPLLILGEPGIGKTRLALAAARLLKHKYLKAVVQPQTEYHELLWSFDHTRRLAAAHSKNFEHDEDEDASARYICPGPLWWALNPADASQKKYSRHSYQPDSSYYKDKRDAATVLLIDEVDKADVNSLALGLLEVLGEEQFLVPQLGRVISSNGPPPLVIFTSNKTRELPPAFIRRCTVLNLELKEPISDYLITLGKQHYQWNAADNNADQQEDVLKQAAKLIADDRAESHRLPRSGVAEFIDLLDALRELSDQPEQQLVWLDRVGRYFCKSH